MRRYRSFMVISFTLMLILVNVAFSEESFFENGNIPSLRNAFSSDPQKFTFAILGDKTAGGQDKWHIFDRAVEEINLINPDFVMIIGDLVQGYTTDVAVMKTMWDELLEHLSKLKIPAILVPGNHDISNKEMYNYWKERLGRTYYSFDYKGCHFLVINSEENRSPEGAKVAGKAQIDFIVSDIEKSKDARHIFVFTHRPLWLEDKKLWKSVESALEDTNYTVFAGHYHQLTYELRNDHAYFIIGTTGGDFIIGGEMDEFSDLRFGLFHHFAFVSVDGSNVNVAIVQPGSILPETVSTKDFHDLLEASIVQFKPEMPIPGAGETVSGKLTAVISDKLDKTIGIKMHISAIDETRWKMRPKELVMEVAPGEEKQAVFELTYNSDSISAPPKYVLENYYDGKFVWKYEQSVELMNTSSMRLIDRWMTVGPFDIPDVKGRDPTEAENATYNYFSTALEPEADFNPDRTYESGIGPISWQAKPLGEQRRFDLDEIYDGADYVVAYAQAFIHSPADTTVWGAIVANDVASVFINSKQTSPIFKLRDMRWQFVFFPVSLKAGWNQVMVKCADCSGDWYFTFGLDDPESRLKFSVEPGFKQ